MVALAQGYYLKPHLHQGLAGLWSHMKGGFPDGRFATSMDVVNHYNNFKKLSLTEEEKKRIWSNILIFIGSLHSPVIGKRDGLFSTLPGVLALKYGVLPSAQAAQIFIGIKKDLYHSNKRSRVTANKLFNAAFP